MPYIITLVIVILIIGIWWITTNNKFRQLFVKIDEASSGIDVALTKRYDSLTKLIDITKAYAIHEVVTFEKIVNLRKGMTVAEKSDINGQLDNMSSRINILAENYPELKASENYRQLQVAASDVEEHLQAARRLYNSNVSLLNQLVVSFPSNAVSKSLGIKKQDFFIAEEAKRADISIKL